MQPSSLFLVFYIAVSPGATRKVCTTDSCLRLAQLVSSFVNTSSDACNDFYQFACGTWNQQALEADDGVETSVPERVKSKILNISLNALLTQNYERRPKVYKLARQFFRTCTHYEPSDKLSQREVMKYLRSFANWPFLRRSWNKNEFDVFAVLGKLQGKLGVGTLVSLSIDLDRKNNTRRALNLGGLQLDYPVAYYNETIFANFTEKYVEFVATTLEQLAVNMKLKRNRTIVEEVAKSIVDLEKDLSRFTILDVDTNSYDAISRLYNPRSVRQLDAVFNSSKHAFEHYFAAVFENDSTALEWLTERPVIVAQPDYLHYLASVLQKKPKAIANYLMWRLLVSLSSNIDTEMFDIKTEADRLHRRRVLKLFERRKETKQARRGECVTDTATYFNRLFDRLYVESDRKNFDLKADAARVVTKKIVDATIRKLESSSWLSKKDKERMVAKLKSIQLNVGYSPKIFNDSYICEGFEEIEFTNRTSYFQMVLALSAWDYTTLFPPVDRKEIENDATDANAQYNTDLNSLSLPLGVMDDWFFNRDFPDAFNYGALGTTIGHELTHGFDLDGIHFNKDGHNLGKQSLLDSMKEFTNRTRCLRDLYSSQCYNFSVTSRAGGESKENITDDDQIDIATRRKRSLKVPKSEIIDSYLYCIDGKRTLNENFADVGGLKVAWLAYKSASKGKGENLLLRGLEDVDMDKLFFVAYSMYYCGPTEPYSLRENLLGEDGHSPDDARIRVVMGNSDDFLNTFKCKNRNGTMEKTCNLY